ncbi:MAG: hypothetical protein UT61_C0030G0008 [Candidatus Woesebacteria bacterium GW2011_GWA1_39_8]|uniref:Uncharacterized protein n=1 Tax=Candidatus Woesebacteria bacterium GW2011_GWA1_39_8 TaxID=1618552 RepID=A0A0G0S496_9BACT|nr:MAG: hypothetical protein UT61_C0030G0008 [Candidatus Woesebacteria bacterium GW2011_GWA1_39_8]
MERHILKESHSKADRLGDAVVSGKIRVESVEFPHDFQERKEIFLASFNKSTACVVLLLLPEVGRFVPPKGLYKGFVRTYDGTVFENVNRNTPADYCRYLAKRGLVQVQQFEYESGYVSSRGFSLTEAGRGVGRSVAALALSFEAQNGFSLFEVLRSPNRLSSDNRSTPYTVARFLEYLYPINDFQRKSDIIRSLGFPNDLGFRILMSMTESGIVERKVVGNSVFLKISRNGRMVVDEFLEPLNFLIRQDIENCEPDDGLVVSVLSRLSHYARQTAPLYFLHSHSNKMRAHDSNIQAMVRSIDESDFGMTSQQLSRVVGLHPATVIRNLDRNADRFNLRRERYAKGVIKFTRDR